MHWWQEREQERLASEKRMKVGTVWGNFLSILFILLLREAEGEVQPVFIFFCCLFNITNYHWPPLFSFYNLKPFFFFYFAVYEKPSIVVRSYDATVSEGNDALLKCSVSSELYEVVAWHTDDGEIFLPFGASTTCKCPNKIPFFLLRKAPKQSSYFVHVICLAHWAIA